MAGDAAVTYSDAFTIETPTSDAIWSTLIDAEASAEEHLRLLDATKDPDFYSVLRREGATYKGKRFADLAKSLSEEQRASFLGSLYLVVENSRLAIQIHTGNGYQHPERGWVRVACVNVTLTGTNQLVVQQNKATLLTRLSKLQARLVPEGAGRTTRQTELPAAPTPPIEVPAPAPQKLPAWTKHPLLNTFLGVGLTVAVPGIVGQVGLAIGAITPGVAARLSSTAALVGVLFLSLAFNVWFAGRFPSLRPQNRAEWRKLTWAMAERILAILGVAALVVVLVWIWRW